MAMNNNQFGYVENSGMGIAGYEDRKESPQRNNPPMDTRTNKDNKPKEEKKIINENPRKDDDDDVLIFIPSKEEKERPMPTQNKENRPKSGFRNSEIYERSVEIPDRVEKSEEDRPWDRDEKKHSKKKKDKENNNPFDIRECEDWHFNRHRTGASHFKNGNSNQRFVYQKRISYMDPEDDETDINFSDGMDEIKDEMSLNVDKDILDELNKEDSTPFDDIDSFFDPKD